MRSLPDSLFGCMRSSGLLHESCLPLVYVPCLSVLSLDPLIIAFAVSSGRLVGSVSRRLRDMLLFRAAHCAASRAYARAVNCWLASALAVVSGGFSYDLVVLSSPSRVGGLWRELDLLVPSP